MGFVGYFPLDSVMCGRFVNYGQILSLDFLDIWGNEAADWDRYKNLTLSFYTSTDATGTPIATSGLFSPDYNGTNIDPTFGRFDVTALIADAATRATIQSFRIDKVGSSDYLELFEVRAAGSALSTPGTAPEPSTLILAALSFVGLVGRRRRKR